MIRIYLILFVFAAISNVSAGTAENQEAVARLSFKSVLYAQHQSAYLEAITEILVAEEKHIWQYLPHTAKKTVSSDNLLPQDLRLIEASLYQYFGMEKEAERLFLEVVKKKAAHLPTAYLLLAKYYFEQKALKKALHWLKKIDKESISAAQYSYRQYFLIETYIR